MDLHDVDKAMLNCFKIMLAGFLVKLFLEALKSYNESV